MLAIQEVINDLGWLDIRIDGVRKIHCSYRLTIRSAKWPKPWFRDTGLDTHRLRPRFRVGIGSLDSNLMAYRRPIIKES
jgi:hypothetical protein